MSGDVAAVVVEMTPLRNYCGWYLPRAVLAKLEMRRPNRRPG